ncbi:MAG: cupin domain-containing protein [Anaerolineales bacterium]|nr:cupin domain-containing protein [Anaerolineales bacterium]
MSVKASYELETTTVKDGEGVTKQVLISAEEGPNFAMRRFAIQPGGGMPNHTNQVEHEQYVLQGEAEIGIAEEVFHVKKDDVVFIPAGIPHWYRNKGEEPFEFLCLVPNKPDKTIILE